MRRKAVGHMLHNCVVELERPWKSSPTGPALELHVNGLKWSHTSRGPLEISPVLGISVVSPHSSRVDLLEIET